MKGRINHMLITKRTIEKLRNKDEETFEQIYYEYEKLVYYICFQITKDKHASEDLVQDTFIKLLTSLDNYQETGKFKQYLMMIARNLSKNYVTRILNKQPILDEDNINLKKDENNVNKMMMFITENLDEQSAEIVILKIVHNLKFKEIAEFKNLSIGSIQATYYQAIKILKKELDTNE